MNYCIQKTILSNVSKLYTYINEYDTFCENIMLSKHGLHFEFLEITKIFCVQNEYVDNFTGNIFFLQFSD